HPIRTLLTFTTLFRSPASAAWLFPFGHRTGGAQPSPYRPCGPARLSPGTRKFPPHRPPAKPPLDPAGRILLPPMVPVHGRAVPLRRRGGIPHRTQHRAAQTAATIQLPDGSGRGNRRGRRGPGDARMAGEGDEGPCPKPYLPLPGGGRTDDRRRSSDRARILQCINRTALSRGGRAGEAAPSVSPVPQELSRYGFGPGPRRPRKRDLPRPFPD